MGASGKATGRPLPLRVEDITSSKINVEAKHLIVEVLTLIRSRFPSVRDMIRFAMTQPDRPSWAVGLPTNKQHLSNAGSRVTRFLGKGAEQPPDWLTVQWIVRACTPAKEREQVLARFAGRWCAATGTDWPPGYVGPVERGENAVQRLTDPDHAPDDATRAHLYQQQLHQAQTTITELLQARQELHLQVEALTACTAHAGQRIRELEEAYRAKDAEVGQKVLANRRRFEQHLQWLQSGHADQARRTGDRLDQVSHHLAVLTAHVVARGAADDLLPIPGLAVDTELKDLLDPPTPPTTPVAAWLVVYLRAIVLLHHGLDYPTAFSAVDNNLTTVVAHGGLPDTGTITALLHAHPMLRAYASQLYRAAHAENAGRSTPLTSVDPRTPIEQRFQDADTVQLHMQPPARRLLPPPPPTSPRPKAGRPAVTSPDHPRPTMVPGEPAQQVTVAELVARYGHPPRPARRNRHRAAPPAIDDSG